MSDRRTAVIPGTGETDQPRRRALVVEDNPHVRRLIITLVEDLGFDVVEAESGDEARRLLDQLGACISLVLTDLRLPGLTSGIDLAFHCHRHHAHLRVLLASGDTPDVLPMFSQQVDFLAKPFSREELNEKISGLFAEPLD